MASQSIKNPAIGPYEAACLLGVHWTRVPKMADDGVLRSRGIKSSVGRPRIRVYSLSDVNKNWTDYQHMLREGQLPRRQRANVDLRPGMLKEISEIEQHIDFYDAISVYEAAEIMGVWHSFPPRMAANGEIVARRLLSYREGGSRSLIYSRKSCEENAERARRLQGETHAGRPRHGL